MTIALLQALSGDDFRSRSDIFLLKFNLKIAKSKSLPLCKSSHITHACTESICLCNNIAADANAAPIGLALAKMKLYWLIHLSKQAGDRSCVMPRLHAWHALRHNFTMTSHKNHETEWITFFLCMVHGMDQKFFFVISNWRPLHCCTQCRKWQRIQNTQSEQLTDWEWVKVDKHIHFDRPPICDGRRRRAREGNLWETLVSCTHIAISLFLVKPRDVRKRNNGTYQGPFWGVCTTATTATTLQRPFCCWSNAA